MTYAQGSRRLRAYRRRIGAIRTRMREVQRRLEPEPVQDYVFATARGPRRLSALFGTHRDLFVVHNMGASCPYCTLWADGYNGLYRHVASRAAFVASPDPPAVQQRFARSRGWRFPMVSHAGTTFARDMGYRSPAGGFLPGNSAFRRERARLVRVSDAAWSPGDDFCALWHLQLRAAWLPGPRGTGHQRLPQGRRRHDLSHVLLLRAWPRHGERRLSADGPAAEGP
jgi:predicted dithiol-disulfide oxidoreductase (DUF899 family)